MPPEAITSSLMEKLLERLLFPKFSEDPRFPCLKVGKEDYISARLIGKVYPY